MLSGNIGEWSEVYVFFKLLAEGKLHTASSDLSFHEGSYYPIVKILRQQKDFSYDYEISGSDVRISSNHKTQPDIFISRISFENAANELIRAIAMAEGNFSVPAAESIINDAHISSLKEPHSDKGDISILAHDSRIGKETEMSFSIKSQLGSPSTLLNASGATNFQFLLSSDLTDLQIDELNNLGLKVLIQQLISDGIEISFLKTNNSQFASNLQMIDYKMPQIIATMLLAYYSGAGTTLSDLTHAVKGMDPATFGPNNSSFYTHKIKTLLSDVALGMTPSRPWKGEYDATGGYIIVRQDGQIVCFHAYNREEFREYLLVSTKFETGSRKKHNFGHLYRIDSGICIDLNLQIRFL